MSHNDVVDLIREAGDNLTLNVISVTSEEADHLEMDARPLKPAVR